MVGMSKSLAFEVASRGITVIIAPGFIETPMTDKLNEEQKTKIMNQILLGEWDRYRNSICSIIFSKLGGKLFD